MELSETRSSNLPVTREQEGGGEGDGPPLKQMRLGKVPSRPRRLLEANGARGRRRERVGSRDGLSSGSTVHAPTRKSKRLEHQRTYMSSSQNGETTSLRHSPTSPHTSTPSPVFINLCTPSPPTAAQNNMIAFECSTPSTTNTPTSLEHSTTATPGDEVQSADGGNHIPVNQLFGSVSPPHLPSGGQSSGAATSADLSSTQLAGANATSTHTCRTASSSCSNPSLSQGSAAEVPPTNLHSHRYSLRPRKIPVSASTQNQTSDPQSHPPTIQPCPSSTHPYSPSTDSSSPSSTQTHPSWGARLQSSAHAPSLQSVPVITSSMTPLTPPSQNIPSLSTQSMFGSLRHTPPLPHIHTSTRSPSNSEMSTPTMSGIMLVHPIAPRRPTVPLRSTSPLHPTAPLGHPSTSLAGPSSSGHTAGTQSSHLESLDGMMMERYWNNLRSRLDRSTRFIASQSDRHTDSRLAGTTSGRPTSQARGATHNQFQAAEPSVSPHRTSVITTAPPSAREAVTSNSTRPSVNWRLLHGVTSPGTSSASMATSSQHSHSRVLEPPSRPSFSRFRSFLNAVPDDEAGTPLARAMATSSQHSHSRVLEPPSRPSFSRFRSFLNAVPDDEAGTPLARAMATGSQHSHSRVLEPMPVSHTRSFSNTGQDDEAEASLSRSFRPFHSPTWLSEWRINRTGGPRTDGGVGGSQLRPLAGSRGSEVEVIVVDSDDDDEEDYVLIDSVEDGSSSSRQRQIMTDEALARELQEQFDREALVTHVPPSPHIWSARGPSGPIVPPGFPVVPTGLMGEDDGEDEEEGTRLIRDNFHALATRVQNWTASDAARFLRVATQRRRQRPRSRREFMSAVMDLPPGFLYRTVSFREPTNSYEDLLELAERLGPARCQGLSKQVINSLPVREFSATRGSPGSSSDAAKCVVCMCDFDEAEKVTTLPCVHEFHQKCINYWLKDHRTCPICRVEVQV